jgi:glyoxylase-like metal-dependent hydrolase (beta-lactamase superfamily II)
MIRRISVGSLACAVISDGQPAPPWEPPVGMFFTKDSGVPEAELADALTREGTNRTTLTCGYNCLWVQTPDGVAVIDTGLGPSFLGYGPDIGAQVGKLADRLPQAGFAPSDVTAVVFTHLHQDHVRGAVWSGRLTFPDATAFAHDAEISFWKAGAKAGATAGAKAGATAQKPADTTREHAAAAREAIALFADRLEGFDYGTEILPGVWTVDAKGHTPGHTAILLGTGTERLLCLGDCFYDPLQLRNPAWCTPWDIDPQGATRTRRTLLAQAADENLFVHAYHMPFPGLGHIRRHGEAFDWEPFS